MSEHYIIKVERFGRIDVRMVMNSKLSLISILVGCLSLTGCQFLPNNETLTTAPKITENALMQVKDESQEEPQKKVVIAAVGDIMIHNPQLIAQKQVLANMTSSITSPMSNRSSQMQICRLPILRLRSLKASRFPLIPGSTLLRKYLMH